MHEVKIIDKHGDLVCSISPQVLQKIIWRGMSKGTHSEFANRQISPNHRTLKVHTIVCARTVCSKVAKKLSGNAKYCSHACAKLAVSERKLAQRKARAKQCRS